MRRGRFGGVLNSDPTGMWTCLTTGQLPLSTVCQTSPSASTRIENNHPVLGVSESACTISHWKHWNRKLWPAAMVRKTPARPPILPGFFKFPMYAHPDHPCTQRLLEHLQSRNSSSQSGRSRTSEITRTKHLPQEPPQAPHADACGSLSKNLILVPMVFLGFH